MVSVSSREGDFRVHRARLCSSLYSNSFLYTVHYNNVVDHCNVRVQLCRIHLLLCSTCTSLVGVQKQGSSPAAVEPVLRLDGILYEERVTHVVVRYNVLDR